MTIAQALSGKTLYHSVHNPQGVTMGDFENIGGKLGSDGWAFPDESKGTVAVDGFWPDADERWKFIAKGDTTEEVGDGLE